ncbi:uncharacterized protein A1O9_05649 [Exophiala aquamarina CBS 119918]|uniref:Capsule synthesis protein CapA domain-containing protein n=1 Tax=Exophiala aquamarina CBS 119918 TaxID=1182545 RepID=A0A072PQF2_9EURO|nr:uncharacterized protein A1O9_05649 [Exophiala aquamarina CBS 119918]KEF57730.1 hypothetical protein A1O9_05649 [Exophiala aquamarina CBS 119918]
MVFTVVATGDLVINGPLQRPVDQNQVYDHVRNADSCFSNLEMPFSRDGLPSEKLIALKCDPIHAPIIRDVGVDVVTMANNHGMDYGNEGLLTTAEALDGADVAHVGFGKNSLDSFAPVVKKIKNTNVAYIGVTTTLPNGSGAGPSRPGLAGVRVFTKYVIDTVTLDESPGMSPFSETVTYKPDEEVLLQTIRDARAKADVVLVGIHWGVPYGWVAATQDEIATYQQPLAHAIVDAGASAIFGHHPHVVQGVELYREVPVFYSLGNFIFSNTIVTPNADFRKYPPYSWTSLQATLSNIGALAKISWDGGRLIDCSIIPLTIAEDGEPCEATTKDTEVLISRLNILSKGRGVHFDLRQLEGGFEIGIVKA